MHKCNTCANTIIRWVHSTLVLIENFIKCKKQHYFITKHKWIYYEWIRLTRNMRWKEMWRKQQNLTFLCILSLLTTNTNLMHKIQCNWKRSRFVFIILLFWYFVSARSDGKRLLLKTTEFVFEMVKSIKKIKQLNFKTAFGLQHYWYWLN